MDQSTLKNLKHYFSSEDSSIITSKKDFDTSLPFPRPKLLLVWLENPNIRNLLPIEIHDQGKLGSLNWLKESMLSYRLSVILVGIYFIMISPSIIFFRRLGKVHDHKIKQQSIIAVKYTIILKIILLKLDTRHPDYKAKFNYENIIK